jgi:predicted O-methyltransferase YrrM
VCIARGLAPGGHLTCFEVSERYAGIARANLERAGVADRVTIVVGPAADRPRTIAALNERIARDERADSVLLSLGDGVTIVRRR